MKNIHQYLVLFAFLSFGIFGLLSCDSDTATIQVEDKTNFSLKNSDVLPGNINNPYDEAGWLHTELSKAYYEALPSDSSVSEVVAAVEKLASSNSSFNAVMSPDYHPVSISEVEHLLDHPTTCLADAITASSMTVPAQLSLLSFVNSYLLLSANEDNADVLYETIVAYESLVLKALLFTETDRRILLTTTSIARYSTYEAKKKPKKNTDPDWTIFVGNITAALEGAEYGTAEAVMKGLVTGIVQNGN